ncbi:hypothetical protein [Burkholderia sp. Ac-20379]|uniref:hypothetical protein n=1 Tax=Burkholderia sp. Ac-20379 TaxID=2703900 RepID=UPI00197FCFBC|nr:hypothetical protein [Burkholderia sp. Ac-20379]MBN3727553.1 hypothetical protein [Burkholderia sp. Ac-20379]
MKSAFSRATRFRQAPRSRQACPQILLASLWISFLASRQHLDSMGIFPGMPGSGSGICAIPATCFAAVSGKKRVQSTPNRRIGCAGNRLPGGVPIASDDPVTRRSRPETAPASRAAAWPGCPQFLLATLWIS